MGIGAERERPVESGFEPESDIIKHKSVFVNQKKSDLDIRPHLNWMISKKVGSIQGLLVAAGYAMYWCQIECIYQ